MIGNGLPDTKTSDPFEHLWQNGLQLLECTGIKGCFETNLSFSFSTESVSGRLKVIFLYVTENVVGQ